MVLCLNRTELSAKTTPVTAHKALLTLQDTIEHGHFLHTEHTNSYDRLDCVKVPNIQCISYVVTTMTDEISLHQDGLKTFKRK